MFKKVLAVVSVILISQYLLFVLFTVREMHRAQITLQYEGLRQDAIKTCQQIAASTESEQWGYKECVKEMIGTVKKASLL